MDELRQQIDQHIPSTNLFFAIRIHGNFPGLTTRAIPQLFPPYPHLPEELKQQVKLSFQNIEGTLVAFRCLPLVKGINQVGCHCHFISDVENAERSRAELHEWARSNGKNIREPAPVPLASLSKQYRP